MVYIIDLTHIENGLSVYVNDNTPGLWTAQAEVNGKFDDVRGINHSPLGALENWIVSYNSRLTPLQADRVSGERSDDTGDNHAAA